LRGNANVLCGRSCGSDCLIATQSDCARYGGSYQGDGTLCEPDPCPTSSVDVETAGTLSLSLRTTPTPSTGTILIDYHLPHATPVTIEIFNAAGVLVRRAAEGPHAPGRHAMAWDGRDDRGHALPSGVYLARIVTAEGTATGRAVIAR